MSEYLLVETQTGPASERFLADGAALAGAGGPVCLFLATDAVGTAVAGASDALAELLKAGAEVWVDGFTLEQRALPRAVLAEGVRVATMDQVAEKIMAGGVRTVWH